MKRIGVGLISLCFMFSVQVNAQDQKWQTVSIPGICTYQIPSTLEIQKGTYKQFTEKFGSEILEITYSGDRVVAQPKGINSFDRTALKRYCRVIVETDRGASGDYYNLDAPLALSKAELREIDSILKQQLQQSFARSTARGMKMELLSWQLVQIVRVNGVDALKSTYSRSVNDGPAAIVSMYMIQNNDCMHKITISYRLSEKALWAKDLRKVIDTFKFKKR